MNRGKLTYNRYDILLQIVKVEIASLHFNSWIKTGWKPLALSCDNVTGFLKMRCFPLSCFPPFFPPVSFLVLPSIPPHPTQNRKRVLLKMDFDPESLFLSSWSALYQSLLLRVVEMTHISSISSR